jgi:hypothetical protein
MPGDVILSRDVAAEVHRSILAVIGWRHVASPYDGG